MTPHPSRALFNQNVIQIACGAGHSFVLVEKHPVDAMQNVVYSWGKCNFGQLGKTPFASAHFFNSILTFSVGHGEEDVDKNAPTHVSFFDGLGVASLSCGDAYTLAVLHCGDVYSWGSGQPLLCPHLFL